MSNILLMAVIFKEATPLGFGYDRSGKRLSDVANAAKVFYIQN